MARIPTASTHDPDEKSTYTVDWTARLDTSETISTSVWSYTGSPDTTVLVLSGDTTSGATASTFVDNGTSGTTYTILNRITTSTGRTLDQSFYIHVRSR